MFERYFGDFMLMLSGFIITLSHASTSGVSYSSISFALANIIWYIRDIGATNKDFAKEKKHG